LFYSSYSNFPQLFHQTAVLLHPSQATTINKAKQGTLLTTGYDIILGSYPPKILQTLFHV
jgi:hypothetical protein